MKTLRAALQLALKDLRLYARDKAGLALGFLLPIALIAVFAAVFGGIGGDGGATPKPKLQVLDLDENATSAAVVDALKSQNVVALVAWGEGRKPGGRDAAVERVRSGDAPMVLVIGPGFEEALKNGATPPLELVRETSRTIEAQIASQALLAALMATQGDAIGRVMTHRGIDALGDSTGMGTAARKMLKGVAGGFFDKLSSEAAKGDGAESSPAAATADASPAAFFDIGSAVGVTTTVVGGEAAGATRAERIKVGMLAQSVAGTAVMMLLFGLAACGATLLQEKEDGTLRRLLACPTPPSAILYGKFLYAFVVGCLQLFVMFTFGRVVYGLPVEKHLFGTAAFIAATAAAATGFGVLLAVVGRSRKQIEGLSTLIILVMSAIGGSWFPQFIMPEWMQRVAGFTLTGWSMKGFQGLYYFGKSTADLWPQLALLFGLAAALLALSTALFRRRFAA